MNDTTFSLPLHEDTSVALLRTVYFSISPYNVKAELLSVNDAIFFIVGPSRTD